MLGEELEDSTVSKNELEVERNRLDQSQQIARLGDWEYFPDKEQFVCSKSFFDILEVSAGSYREIFLQILSKVHPEDRKEVEHFYRIVNEMECITVEARILLKDGSVRHLLSIVNHIQDQTGRHHGFKGIVQDITQLKESQLKLAYQTKLQKLIAEISSGFINSKQSVVIEVEKVLKNCCTFFDVDRAYFLKFNGITSDDVEIFEWNSEIVPYTTAELFRRSPDLFNICYHTVQSNEVVQFSDAGLIENKTESEMTSQYSVKAFICIPVYGTETEFAIFGMDCIGRQRAWPDDDINGLKIISNIISDAINRDYFEKNLIIAREKAEESDRLKSAFLANMSHEIRTPMNGILGFAELLKTPDLSGEMQQEFIALIGESGERLLNTIDDLVNISKLDSGQMNLVYTKTEVNEMMSFMYCFFRYEAEKRGLNLKWSIPKGNRHSFLQTDKEKLYAILTNLIKNALKFTKKGNVEFGYSISSITGIDEFHFYVKDTGVGIPRSKHKSVFERFVQADSELSRGYEGSGLGLAISKAYVEMMGGKIWLESAPGKGTTFFFSLPSYAGDAETGVFHADDIPELNGKLLDAVILVAEDDKDSVLYLETILKGFCAEVICVGNGADAISACRKNTNISLVLMDLKMPVMDGFTAALKIREFRPGLPIIAQTAFALEEERARYGKIFSTYLTKPVRVNVLKQAVFQCLEGVADRK
jgi:signal transduction histidine kinase/ActR/RegA family two-component response regulator